MQPRSKVLHRIFEPRLVQGVAAAALSGAMFYAVSGAWIESSPSDPHILQAAVLWTATFVAGFVLLFWRRA